MVKKTANLLARPHERLYGEQNEFAISRIGQNKLLVFFTLFMALCCVDAHAQENFAIPDSVWRLLGSEEKSQLLDRFSVDLWPSDSFGVLVDAQTLNESTSATTGGASLGSALGSASYIDNSLRGRDYSATEHLGMGLLGAALGATLDTPETQRFKTQYAVRRLDGSIIYALDVQPNAFRHPVGLCLGINPVKVVDQQLCSITKTDVLLRLQSNSSSKKISISGSSTQLIQPNSQTNIKCKLENGSVALIKSSVCVKIGGEIL